MLLAAVYLTIAQFTRSRASSYIERFNSQDALESRVAVDRWLQDNSTAKARLEALDRDPKLRTHLRRFANLFQELGAAYQFGVAHRKTVRVLFDALVVMYWEQLRFWVRDYRAQSDPTLYARFEYLYTEVKSREKKTQAQEEYVIAYGSLMDPRSLGAGLGRDASVDEFIPVNLVGWARRWSIGEKVRLGDNTSVTVAAFLDVEREAGSVAVAVMVKVTRREMKRLTAREKNYEIHDIRTDVRLTGDRVVEPGAVVWCFVGKDRFRVEEPSNSVVVLENYLEKVAGAALRIDPEMAAGLRASASGFPLAPGPYEFVDDAQEALV